MPLTMYTDRKPPPSPLAGPPPSPLVGPPPSPHQLTSPSPQSTPPPSPTPLLPPPSPSALKQPLHRKIDHVHKLERYLNRLMFSTIVFPYLVWYFAA